MDVELLKLPFLVRLWTVSGTVFLVLSASVKGGLLFSLNSLLCRLLLLHGRVCLLGDYYHGDLGFFIVLNFITL